MVVVGAGHAGVEAALACARMGARTACVTLSLDRIAHLPCNCSIGGPAKGHIAREVDALGGQMAIAADRTLTHTRRVGTGKGPAVQTVRTQVCKRGYPQFMRAALEAEPNLTLIEGEVARVCAGPNGVGGVELVGGQALGCRAVVATSGTFLNGLCHEGHRQVRAARHGDPAVSALSESLRNLGLTLRRFKTGTTPRVHMGSLNLALTEVLPSEPDAEPLSFLHDRVASDAPLLATWRTRTTTETHAILRNHLQESAMYGGRIVGVGPRYCPSIEDKVVRFAEKGSHPVFLEKEEWTGDSVYVQGFSTSMPAEVQLAALRTVPGLEEVEFIRPGYAVEYDAVDPLQLSPTLMAKGVGGLFLAGQVNGTSGYEEAAGQGLVAGINAARWARDEEPVVIGRDEAFIGVMVDDLTTKGAEDPYRMLTARSEYRLLLRPDNADERLTPLAMRLGLASEERARRFEAKREAVARGRAALQGAFVTEGDDRALVRCGLSEVRGKTALWDLLRRPEVGLDAVERLANALGLLREGDLPERGAPGAVGAGARERLAIEAIYQGYLRRQEAEVAQARRLESVRIPDGLDYRQLRGLSHESAEKLSRIRPLTVGQAGRIPGVRPADVALLIGWLGAWRAEPSPA